MTFEDEALRRLQEAEESRLDALARRDREDEKAPAAALFGGSGTREMSAEAPVSEQHVTVAQVERGRCYAIGLPGTLTRSELPGGGDRVVNRRDGSLATIWRVKSVGRSVIDYRLWTTDAGGQGCWSHWYERSRRRTWGFGAWFLPVSDPSSAPGSGLAVWQLEQGECYALNGVRNADGSLAVIWRVESIGPKWITYQEWQPPRSGEERGSWSPRRERTLRSGWDRGAPFVPVANPGAWRPAADR